MTHYKLNRMENQKNRRPKQNNRVQKNGKLKAIFTKKLIIYTPPDKHVWSVQANILSYLKSKPTVTSEKAKGQIKNRIIYK